MKRRIVFHHGIYIPNQPFYTKTDTYRQTLVDFLAQKYASFQDSGNQDRRGTAQRIAL